MGWWWEWGSNPWPWQCCFCSCQKEQMVVLLLVWPTPPLLLYWPVSCYNLHALDATPPPQPYGCAVLSYLSHFSGLQIECLYFPFLTCCLICTCLLFSAGPSSVQYQHGTPVLYQAQSGSPPATGLPRVSLATSQQGPNGHTAVPLAQGIPQPQQVTCYCCCWACFSTLIRFEI